MILEHQALLDTIRIYRKKKLFKWSVQVFQMNISSCKKKCTWFVVDVSCLMYQVYNAQRIEDLTITSRHIYLHGQILSIGHIVGLQSFVMLRDCKCTHSESAVLTHSHSSCFLCYQSRVWADESPCTHGPCHSRLRWLCYDFHLHDFLFFSCEVHDA